MIKYLLAIPFLFTTLFAQIIEVNNINELPQYVDADTLVVFDIDNTLLKTKQFLGSDMWFCAQYKRNFDKLGHAGDALNKTLREYLPIMNVSPMGVPEEDAPQVVSDLQKQFITVMGLTSRNLSLDFRTIHQLEVNGMNLNKTAPSKGELHFMNEKGVLFKEGILFTSGTSKGNAFKKFIDAIGYHPKKVLFINDKESNLRDLETGCIDRKIPFIGLRYGSLDEWVENYSQEIADVQYTHFGKILSDHEAKEML